MTVKSRLLSDRQKAVIETIRMRLTEKQSLAYLKEMGFEISPKTYYNDKRKVEELKLKRLYHIAQIGFQDQHLDRIDNTELCLKLMWDNYHLEQDPFKRFQMLKDIVMVQPYLSSYYETTRLIVEKEQQEQQQNERALNNNISINDDEEEFNNNSNAKF